MDGCAGFGCARLDWDKHTTNQHDCDCPHCKDCWEECCTDLNEEAHYAAVYRLVREPDGLYRCPAGHEIDSGQVERRQAVVQMKAAGVTPFI